MAKAQRSRSPRAASGPSRPSRAPCTPRSRIPHPYASLAVLALGRSCVGWGRCGADETGSGRASISNAAVRGGGVGGAARGRNGGGGGACECARGRAGCPLDVRSERGSSVGRVGLWLDDVFRVGICV